jgi:hypothetical protein
VLRRDLTCQFARAGLSRDDAATNGCAITESYAELAQPRREATSGKPGIARFKVSGHYLASSHHREPASADPNACVLRARPLSTPDGAAICQSVLCGEP